MIDRLRPWLPVVLALSVNSPVSSPTTTRATPRGARRCGRGGPRAARPSSSAPSRRTTTSAATWSPPAPPATPGCSTTTPGSPRTIPPSRCASPTCAPIPTTRSSSPPWCAAWCRRPRPHGPLISPLRSGGPRCCGRHRGARLATAWPARWCLLTPASCDPRARSWRRSSTGPATSWRRRGPRPGHGRLRPPARRDRRGPSAGGVRTDRFAGGRGGRPGAAYRVVLDRRHDLTPHGWLAATEAQSPVRQCGPGGIVARCSVHATAGMCGRGPRGRARGPASRPAPGRARAGTPAAGAAGRYRR